MTKQQRAKQAARKKANKAAKAEAKRRNLQRFRRNSREPGPTGHSRGGWAEAWWNTEANWRTTAWWAARRAAGEENELLRLEEEPAHEATGKEAGRIQVEEEAAQRAAASEGFASQTPREYADNVLQNVNWANVQAWAKAWTEWGFVPRTPPDYPDDVATQRAAGSEDLAGGVIESYTPSPSESDESADGDNQFGGESSAVVEDLGVASPNLARISSPLFPRARLSCFLLPHRASAQHRSWTCPISARGPAA